MKKTKFVVLVVEDSPSHQKLARHIVTPYAEVLIAGTLREASEILLRRKDITHAILDGYVPRFSNEPLRQSDTTHEIAWQIINLHDGIKMYTASSDSGINAELVKIGCIPSTKETAPKMVVEDIISQNMA